MTTGLADETSALVALGLASGNSIGHRVGLGFGDIFGRESNSSETVGTKVKLRESWLSENVEAVALLISHDDSDTLRRIGKKKWCPFSTGTGMSI